MKRSIFLFTLAAATIGAGPITVDTEHSAGSQHGITVTATSSVTVPATHAEVAVAFVGTKSSQQPQDALTSVSDALTSACFQPSHATNPSEIFGGLGGSISSIDASTDHPTAARAAAISKARSKADVVARQIGAHVGTIVGITTNEGESRPKVTITYAMK